MSSSKLEPAAWSASWPSCGVEPTARSARRISEVCIPPKPDIAGALSALSFSQAPPFLIERCVDPAERCKGVNDPRRLVADAARIRPMRDPAHAAAARGPEPHEGVPRLGNGKPRVLCPGLTADEPVAAPFGSQAAVVGAGVSSDGEGAPEFPSASLPGCMRVLARQPTASTSSCGNASSRSSGIPSAIGGAFGGGDIAVPRDCTLIRAAVAVVADRPGRLAPAMHEDAELDETLEGSLLLRAMLPAEHDDRLAGLTQPPELVRQAAGHSSVRSA